MKRPLKIRWTACLLAIALVMSMLSGCTVANMQGSGTKRKTVPDAEVEDTVASKELDMDAMEAEKYQIDGTDAFYILPTGSDLSQGMLNFRLLDLIDGKITIYVYQCLYGLTDISGRGGMPESGKAVRSSTSKINSKALTGNTDLATVIMMYNTETQAYQVIHSWTDEVTVTDTQDENGVAHKDVTFRGGSRAVQVEDSLTTIFAQKIIMRDNDDNLINAYYMYAGGVGYFWHYDSDDGKCVFDLTSNIRSALSLAISDAIKKTGKEESQVTTSILEVTADSEMDQYFSLYLTWNNESTEDLSKMSDEELKELERSGANNTSARYITCCFGINFDSATDDNKRFYSNSLVNRRTASGDHWVTYEELAKEWMRVDGQTISESEANAADFLTADDVTALYESNLYQGTPFTFNGTNNAFKVALKYSTTDAAYKWASSTEIGQVISSNSGLFEESNGSSADIDSYQDMDPTAALNICEMGGGTKLDGFPVALGAAISYESQDAQNRFFIFPVSSTKLVDIIEDKVELTRRYWVSIPVDSDEDTEDSGDGMSDTGSLDGDMEETAAETVENADDSEKTEGTGSDADTGEQKYRLDERVETVTFVRGYKLCILQPSAANWYTNEVTSDGMLPSMGSGYLRYHVSANLLGVGKCSGTRQSGSVDYGQASFNGTVKRALFIPPSSQELKTGSSYAIFISERYMRVFRYPGAMEFITTKNVDYNKTWSASNDYLNFSRENQEGQNENVQQDVTAEDVDKVTSWSDETKNYLKSELKECAEKGYTIALNFYKNRIRSVLEKEKAEEEQELLDTPSTESVDVMQGSNQHTWLLSAGVNSGLVLTDLDSTKENLRIAGSTEELASAQLSDMPCYAVYARDNGKELDIIGYDTQEYGYSTADIYRAKLYHRSLFDQKMCYNMVASLAKKYPTVYKSILSDGDAFLSRFSNQWSLGSYQADMSLAKQYVQYKKLVETGVATGKTLFCRLSGLQESELTELNTAKLMDCYDQKAVENLILELCPTLKDQATVKENTGNGSGIKISKETTAAAKATVPASTESISVTLKDDNTASDKSTAATEEITISVDVEKSYQDTETRFKLRSLRCEALGIQTSEWDALVAEMLENLHPAESLNAYIREQLYKYFARMGNLSYTSDMQAEIRRCESWEDAEKLIGYYRMSDKDKITLNMLQSVQDPSDEQKKTLAELETRRQNCIEDAKQDAVKNLYDAYDAKSLLSASYGNSWNEQWQAYWKKMLTRIVEAAKS